MGKLTKEERRALLKARRAQRAIDAEMARRKKEMEHLEREIAFTRKNHTTIHKKFRNEILKIKQKEFRENAETAWKQFNKAIECKDFAISMKLEELEEANQQHLNNFIGHIEQIDKLINMLRTRIADSQQTYLNDLNDLMKMSTDQLCEIKERQFEEEEYFKQMIYQLTCEGNEAIKTRNILQLNKTAAEKSAADDVMQGIRYKFEKQLNNLWSNYLDTLNNYQNHINEHKKEYERLEKADTKHRKLIDQKIEKIALLIESIKHLKIQMKNVETEQNTKLDDLRQERNVFANAFWNLRATMKVDTELDQANIALLSRESSSTIEHLKNIYAKGKQLLTLASICHQMETQQEKIIPFNYTQDRRSRKETSDGGVKFMFYKDIMKIDVKEVSRFWLRMGQAEAETVQLNEERHYILRENNFIKKKLNYYNQSATYRNPYLPRIPTVRYEYYNRKKKKKEPGPINVINCTQILYKIV